MRSLLIVCIIVASCQPSVDPLEQKRAEVMKIHDDAMAKMGELQTTTAELEELKKMHSDSLLIRSLISELNAAEEGMMVWMQEYKEPQDSLKSFYEREKNRIQVVADDIDKSLEDAEKYILSK